MLKHDLNSNMQLFYLPNLNEKSEKAIFSKEESKHIFKVLRKKIGDEISITNGKHIFFKGIINSISKNNCEVHIQNFENDNWSNTFTNKNLETKIENQILNEARILRINSLK